VPGIASNRYPNVVAAALDGQWRPADGYAWVLNPRSSGDMRVKPVPRPEDKFSIPVPENPFERGLTDRTELEQWVAALSGDFRRGAEWWTGRRNEPRVCVRMPSCEGAVGASRCKAQVRSSVSSRLEQLRRPSQAAIRSRCPGISSGAKYDKHIKGFRSRFRRSAQRATAKRAAGTIGFNG
jgi:hypothetical protein